MPNDNKEYTIKFGVAGESYNDKWPGHDGRDALEGWWEHVNSQEIVDMKIPSGWMRVRSADISYAQVLNYGH